MCVDRNYCHVEDLVKTKDEFKEEKKIDLLIQFGKFCEQDPLYS